jgi:P27 family predicted phage terminase small subunit
MKMRRKPPEPAIPPPPSLSDRAKALWSAVVPRRAKSPERLALLQTALEASDRADQAAEVVAHEGMTSKTETTGAIHVHPLVKVDRESHQLFARTWKQLGLDWASDRDATPWPG